MPVAWLAKGKDTAVEHRTYQMSRARDGCERQTAATSSHACNIPVDEPRHEWLAAELLLPRPLEREGHTLVADL